MFEYCFSSIFVIFQIFLGRSSVGEGERRLWSKTEVRTGMFMEGCGGDSALISNNSMASAFGGARGLAAKAPEKGVFPLDHFGECKTVMKDYLACLKKEKGDSQFECKKLSKKYLECRMDKNLMAKEDLGKLGFGKNQAQKPKKELEEGRARKSRAQEGFIPGVRKT